MSPAAFDALATLMSLRRGSPSFEASRLVLVEGMTNADAMRATGLQRASVTKGVRRCEKAMELVMQAADLPRREPPMVSLILWEKIAHLVDQPATGRSRGRPRADDRDMLNAILYVLLHGIDFQELPESLGWGSGSTCIKRLAQWERDGTWTRLRTALQDSLPQYPLIDWERRGQSLAGRRDASGRFGRYPRAKPAD